MKNIKDRICLIKTFNPVNGCNIGCPYCYAKKINQRFHIIPDFNIPTFQKDRLKQLYTKKPNVYLITSMSDFSSWKYEWNKEIFKVLSETQYNQYMILTKRPELINFKTILDNVYIGVTITNKNDKDRIKTMFKNIKAKHYFICFEPLHGDIGNLDLTGIEQIIIGAETGNRKGKIRPQKEWIMNLVRQAKEKNIKVAMKMSLKDIVCENNFTQDFISKFENIFLK